VLLGSLLRLLRLRVAELGRAVAAGHHTQQVLLVLARILATASRRLI